MLRDPARSTLTIIIITSFTEHSDPASNRDSVLQVPSSSWHVVRVSQVRRCDNKSAEADTVTKVTVGLRLGAIEVGDLATGLSIACVAVKNDASDLVFDGCAESAD